LAIVASASSAVAPSPSMALTWAVVSSSTGPIAPVLPRIVLAAMLPMSATVIAPAVTWRLVPPPDTVMSP